MAKTTSELVVEGKKLAVSNLEKVLYPSTGYTKGDIIQYYIAIAPVLLPHLRGHALTLKRYPNGVEGPYFYEKRCPPHRPGWLRTATIFSESRGETIDYCLANDLPSLVWAANLADIELHTSLAMSKNPDRPASMVFDLDPGEGADVIDCAHVALWIRDVLETLRLKCIIKTSGSKGLQLYVPLNTALTFDESRAAAKQLATRVEIDHPDKVVTNMRKSLRRKKVLIDWSQNHRHKTTVCVYSLRATKEPQVSTPLQWREVEKLHRSGDPAKARFGPDDVLKRVAKHGDLFADLLTLKQRLPGQRGRS